MADRIYPAYFETVYATRDVPATMADILKNPEAENWLNALQREFLQHQKNGTFGPPLDSSQLPPNTKPIPFDVIFKKKRDGRYKARGIIKGFWMKAGRDFNETFAPIPCLSTLRFLFAVTAKYDWEAKSGDINTAFLLPRMDTEIYVSVPN